MTDYTLADLVRVTGAKRRSLQLWADRGVIQPIRGTDRAGTGTHRQFSQNEAIIACIVHGFALHQIAIGELYTIARMLRFHFWKEEVPGDIIYASIRKETETLLKYESWMAERKPARQHLITLAENAGDLEFYHLQEREGFAAVIRLRTYLSKLNS